jgi:signal transduction histidine kinase
MWRLCNNVLRVSCLSAAAMAAFVDVTPVFGNVAESSPASLLQITNVMQLRLLANSNQMVAASVSLEGVVWWSSDDEGCVILQDDTGVAQLELDLPCRLPRQGERMSLQGSCTVVKTTDAIKLAQIPVVENDGIHVATEQSGRIFLKAGMYPIRVDWFNRTGLYELEAFYEGPRQPRQKIPDSALFRAIVDPANGVTNFVKGLNYRCCEGMWWGQLPNLSHLAAVRSGVVDNFNLEVESRQEQVGLQFNGFIQLTNDGFYTFYTRSDDGSRLFIGDSSLQVKTAGRVALPDAQPFANTSVQSGMEEYGWSQIEGIVSSVNDLGNALELELITDSGHMRVKVAENSGCSFTLVPQNRIRAVGVCRNIRSLDGGTVPGEFFVQSWNEISQMYVTPDLWSMYPLVKISDMVTRDLRDGSQPVVHLRGKSLSAGSGQPVYLDDGSGHVLLETVEPGHVLGQISEVLGRFAVEGTNPVLRCNFFRRVGEDASKPGAIPVLTTAEQVNQLSREELQHNYPVKLHGVITTVLEGDALVLQDTTRGLYVAVGRSLPLRAGDYCELEGVAAAGEFSPYILASRIEKLGSGTLPNPIHPTWDQLLNGSMHCQYVELEGVVTLMNGDTITLLTRDGPIKVKLDPTAPLLAKTDENALVRLRGCLFADWDKQAQRVMVGNIRINQQWMDVVQPAPIDPFAIPSKHVGELLQFDPQAGSLQRVKISGQIVYLGDAGCFLMDGSSGLRFIPVGTLNAHVCDLVDVVGFPDLSGPAPLLREAVVRRLGLAELPKAHQLEANNLLRDDYDSTLVRVDGVLLGITSTPEREVLEMQSGLRRFGVIVKDKAGLKPLIPGSRLELTGVYVGQGGNWVLGRSINSFQLLLNSGFDIRILSRPPWWTLKRLLSAVSVLLGVLIAAMIWIKLLHRQVAERTLQLETQIQKRQRAERQQAAEQERARVAQDLHDDLGASLTEVNMLTSLVKSPATTAEEKFRYVDELNEKALCMVTSLDEIVWAMNPRNDTVASLASYFGSYAQRFLELASVAYGLDVAEDLPDYPLDPKFRQELFLAFKEALTNVVRHARAKKVWLRISVQQNALMITVADDGCGIAPGKRDAGADGLANMQERLRALGGSCHLQSEPGKGTTVRFEVPLPKILL